MDRRQFLMWSVLFAPFVARGTKSPLLLMPYQKSILDEMHGLKFQGVDIYWEPMLPDSTEKIEE
jgi:hypothetical protein